MNVLPLPNAAAPFVVALIYELMIVSVPTHQLMVLFPIRTESRIKRLPQLFERRDIGAVEVAAK